MRRLLKKFLTKSPLDYYVKIKCLFNNKGHRKRKYNERIISDYMKENDKPKLQIGCGYNEKAGWLNTDLYPKTERIAKLDAGKQFPFDDNSFDFIFSEHIFEHLTFKESCNFLSESFRVLKPKGVIRIAVPHLDFLFKIYQNPHLEIHKDYIKWNTEKVCKDVANLFNGKEYLPVYMISNFFKDWGHQIIHNYESLKELLLVHNFTNIESKEIGKSEFKDLCNMEQHGTRIPPEFNELETMVIEAQKL